VNASQEGLFPLGTTLADASLEQRAAAAQVLIESEATDVDQRIELLLLVVAPEAWGAES
jgi:hypothetical protein